MTSNPKTKEGFLATVNSILGDRNISVDFSLYNERCLDTSATDVDFENQFSPVKLSDIHEGDNVFIHYFIHVQDNRVIEGFSYAKSLEGKLVLEWTNVDSMTPPIDDTPRGDAAYGKLADFAKNFLPILIDSLNNFLSS